MCSCLALIFAGLLVGVTHVDHARSANILGLFPSMGRSHFIIDEALMKGLAAKGHNVTVVSGFQSSNNNHLPNYHEVYLDLDDGDALKQQLADILQKPGQTATSGPAMMPALLRMTNNRSVSAVKHPKMQALMNSGQQFDLFVFGWFLNDFLLGVGGHFKCPIVVVTTFAPMKSIRDLVGNPTAVSSVPLINRGHGTEPMTFLERLEEFIVYTIEYIASILIEYFIYESYYNELFPASKNYPSFDEVKQNVSLVLINQHLSQGKPRPHLPNMVEIGGIQMQDTPNPLPKDIQEFLDGAKNGAILFSLGTNAKFSDMNDKKLTAILAAISKLRQRVIMKWESDTPPKDLPKNAIVRKWLPQGDILAHPNIQLFISHCGLSSVNEAKYRGVPILGIPLFTDQPENAKTIAKEGWAVYIAYEDVTEQTLTSALNEILSNKTYTNVVREKSLRYRDRPQSALDTAVFWVEYVIRHNGARHLKSDAASQNALQKNSLDVIAFLILVIIVAWKLMKFVVVRIFRKFKKVLFNKKVKIN